MSEASFPAYRIAGKARKWTRYRRLFIPTLPVAFDNSSSHSLRTGSSSPTARRLESQKPQRPLVSDSRSESQSSHLAASLYARAISNLSRKEWAPFPTRPSCSFISTEPGIHHFLLLIHSTSYIREKRSILARNLLITGLVQHFVLFR